MYDVIIIGGGICGFTAAMYAGRLGMKTLILEDTLIGGTLATAGTVENWPGIKKISGNDLSMQVVEHAKEYEIDIREERAQEAKIGGSKGCFTVSTDEDSYEGKTVIFATGAKHREHPAKNADKLKNKGVHYCALCDGPLYSEKEVAVIGGGDSATKEALLLSEYASKVYMLVKGDKLRAEPINSRRVENNNKITVLTNTNVIEMKGAPMLESLILKKDGNREELQVSGAFIAIGMLPFSELAISMGINVNEKKEIITDRMSSTSIKGVFACGDVVNTGFKQAIVGAGEAVTAAYWAYYQVNDAEYVCPRGEEKPEELK